MNAAKENFLLRGYYKKKTKAAEKAKEATDEAAEKAKDEDKDGAEEKKNPVIHHPFITGCRLFRPAPLFHGIV